MENKDNNGHQPMPQYPNYPGYPYPMAMRPLRLGRFLTYLQLYWWVPVLLTALALCLVSFYTLRQPAVYVSKASLWASGRLKLPEGGAYSEEAQFFYGTQVELLKSDRLQTLASNRVQTLQPKLIPCRVDLRIRQAPKTAIFSLEVTGTEPEFTQAYLQALIDEYFNIRRSVRSESSEDTLSSLTAELETAERKLNAAQDQLLNGSRENSLEMLQQQNRSASAQLAKLMVDRSDLEQETGLLDLVRGETQSGGAGTNTLMNLAGSSWLSNSALSGRSSDYFRARQQVDMLRLERDDLARFLRPQHPKIQRLDEDINRAEELLKVYQSQSLEQLAGRKQSLELELQTVEEKIDEWRQRVLTTSQKLTDLERYRIEVSEAQALRDRLNGLLQSLDVNRNLDQETVSVMEPASAAKAQANRLPLKLAMAGFLSLFFGVGLIYFLEVVDDRLVSFSDLTERFDLDATGSVPEVPRRWLSSHVRPVEEHDGRHAFAEAWRSLRSALMLARKDEAENRVLVVTSAIPSEGKSTVALNLARALAFTGARVLLVDADLRRGVLHRLLKTSNELGLTELLTTVPVDEEDHDPDIQLSIRAMSERALASRDNLSPDEVRLLQETVERLDETMAQRIESVMLETNLPNLWFVPSGGYADNAGELFLGVATDAFIKQVRDRYDYVIIDSAPVLAADDTACLAAKADGCLFITRRNFTRAKVAEAALGLLVKRQIRIVGMVFNRARTEARDNYFYKYRQYYGQRPKDRPVRPSVPASVRTRARRRKSARTESDAAVPVVVPWEK